MQLIGIIVDMRSAAIVIVFGEIASYVFRTSIPPAFSHPSWIERTVKLHRVRVSNAPCCAASFSGGLDL
jgi:hypothetical protein